MHDVTHVIGDLGLVNCRIQGRLLHWNGRSLRHGKNEGNVIRGHFYESRGGEILIIKGERKIKLLKHKLAQYSIPLTFSKIFSLATLARFNFILQLKMQACNDVALLYQSYTFLYFGVIFLDS